MTLGSLFDGAGTFPFAALQNGIVPLWASEIEPFPISVTKARLPKMQHLGDITKIDGSKIPPVDIITFGSPCQDLSVAGNRAGLDGNRSGLFRQAVRIIEEMRRSTNGKYPRYAVWENVPGAFSSHRGEDFRTVLEELAKVKDSTTTIPRPASGKWKTAGIILADDYSLAWRVLDAQFWGVPQRRRRIFLVADFRGQRAAEILFERNGLPRSFAESRKAWNGNAADTDSSTAKTGQADGRRTDTNGFNPPPILLDNHPNDSRVTVSNEKCVQTLTSRMGTGGGNTPMLLQAIGYDRYNQAITGDKSQTLKAYNGSDDIPAVILNDQGGSCIRVEHGNISPTLRAQDHGHPPCVMDENPKECYTLITGGFVTLDKDKAQTLTARDYKFPQSVCYSGDIAGTLDAHYYLGCGARGGKEREFVAQQTSEYNWVIRRLTPKECCRLQGMPDWWVDGIEHKDAPEYKMWGNGMALPCALYVMEGIAKANKKDLLNEIGGTS